MHDLPLSAVPRWKQASGSRWIPISVDTYCPHCGREVNFPLRDFLDDKVRNSFSASATCPGCGEASHFWVVRPSLKERGCEALCIHPDPRRVREPIVSASDTGNGPLSRAYESSISALNAGLWDPCAASCRRTLEAIVHHLNPEKASGPLFDRLEKLFEDRDLSEPLVRISEVLRKGGNVGAHFDLEIETDQAMAEKMVDLIDYFLEYLFVLPNRAQELEARLTKDGQNRPAETGDV